MLISSRDSFEALVRLCCQIGWRAWAWEGWRANLWALQLRFFIVLALEIVGGG